MTVTDGFDEWDNDRLLRHVARRLEQLHMDTTALTQAVSDLQTLDTQLASVVTTAFTDLSAEITNLENGISTGDQSAIDSAVSALTQIKTDLAAVVTEAEAADPGAQPAPTPPTPAGPVLDPASSLPLYVAPTGSSTIDASVWTQVTDVTDNGAPLYTFSGDSVGNPPTGVESGWTLFVGTPTPVAAS